MTLFSGYYLFVETSSPAVSGDKARLLSQEFSATEGLCMSFWYHMYGSTMGALRILTKANGKETLIWDKHGDQGNKWVESKLKMNGSTAFKVMWYRFREKCKFCRIFQSNFPLKPCVRKVE